MLKIATSGSNPNCGILCKLISVINSLIPYAFTNITHRIEEGVVF